MLPPGAPSRPITKPGTGPPPSFVPVFSFAWFFFYVGAAGGPTPKAQGIFLFMTLVVPTLPSQPGGGPFPPPAREAPDEHFSFPWLPLFFLAAFLPWGKPCFYRGRFPPRPFSRARWAPVCIGKTCQLAGFAPAFRKFFAWTGPKGIFLGNPLVPPGLAFPLGNFLQT